VKFKIIISPQAMQMLRDIGDVSIRTQLNSRIDELQLEPSKKGKSLAGDLRGFRSIRAAGQRYRIIYKVVDGKVEVYVASLGIRRSGDKKDVYAIAQKLFRAGLLD